MENIVRLKGISREYLLGETKVTALKGIDLDIRRGDFVAVAGPSGAGKTTAMNIIGLIDSPSSGTVEICGTLTNGLNDYERTGFRHKVLGFIFQSFNLIPVLNMRENIELPLYFGKKSGISNEQREWIDFIIEETGLQDRMEHRPSELSGGQRQRVAIARALAGKPEIVIADEPTANLDSVTGESILSLMERINREFNTTFIFSTHDSAIKDMAHHVISLKDGKIESESRSR